MVSTYIVLFPDIIATLLVLDQLIVFWLAATEQICEGLRQICESKYMKANVKANVWRARRLKNLNGTPQASREPTASLLQLK